jgi:hypothetical protein
MAKGGDRESAFAFGFGATARKPVTARNSD